MVVIKHSRFDPTCEIGQKVLRGEAQILRHLHHSGIVRLLATSWEVDPASRSQYLVLELVDGMTVTQATRDDPIRGARGVLLALSITEIVSYVHQRGFLHRDIKPGNIIWNGERAVLLDFGLGIKSSEAVIQPQDGDSFFAKQDTVHHTGNIHGTAGFIAPEVVFGWAPDERSDLFALGVTLFRIAGAKWPFYGENNTELTLTSATKSPIELASGNRSFDAIIMKLLEKKPEDRFQSAAAVVEALSELL